MPRVKEILERALNTDEKKRIAVYYAITNSANIPEGSGASQVGVGSAVLENAAVINLEELLKVIVNNIKKGASQEKRMVKTSPEEMGEETIIDKIFPSIKKEINEQEEATAPPPVGGEEQGGAEQKPDAAAQQPEQPEQPEQPQQPQTQPSPEMTRIADLTKQLEAIPSLKDKKIYYISIEKLSGSQQPKGFKIGDTGVMMKEIGEGENTKAVYHDIAGGNIGSTPNDFTAETLSKIDAMFQDYVNTL
jgi:hypothetical protein